MRIPTGNILGGESSPHSSPSELTHMLTADCCYLDFIVGERIPWYFRP